MSAQALLVSNRLLEAVVSVQTAFIQGRPPPRLFEPLLSVLLELTGSESAFIAEWVPGPRGAGSLQPLVALSMGGLPWQGALPDHEAAQTLLRGVVEGGRPGMTNRPLGAETRTLLGLPLLVNHEVVGVLGLANRPGGYHDSLVSFLDPCLPPCGALVVGLRAEHRRRGAEQQLRQQVQERLVATERLASLGTLTAGMAHEINNPLAYMLSNLSYVSGELHSLIEEDELLQGERGRDLVEALDETLSGSQRVRDIVRDLKLFSRNTPEQQGLVDVSSLLDSCVNMAWGEIKHRARLVKDYGVVPPLYGNEARLAQVFLHLIVNAVQALPPRGGQEGEIRLSTRHEEGLVMVSIHDTGVGIPEEDLDRLFDPFFTTKAPSQGTGLGLSICKGIVTQLGGRIMVESQPGRGSTFRVFLPTQIAASRAETLSSAESPASAR